MTDINRQLDREIAALTIRLPRSDRVRFGFLCNQRGLTMAGVVKMLIMRWCDEQDRMHEEARDMDTPST